MATIHNTLRFTGRVVETPTLSGPPSDRYASVLLVQDTMGGDPVALNFHATTDTATRAVEQLRAGQLVTATARLLNSGVFLYDKAGIEVYDPILVLQDFEAYG